MTAGLTSAFATYAPHAAQLARALRDPAVVRSLPKLDDGYLRDLLMNQVASSGGELWVVSPGADSQRIPAEGPSRHLREWSLASALDELRTLTLARPDARRVVLWARDPGECTASAEVLARIKEVDRLLRSPACKSAHRVLISGHWSQIPELSRVVGSLELDRPRGTDLTAYVAALLTSFAHGEPQTGEENQLRDIGRALQGLDASSIQKVLLESWHQTSGERSDDAEALLQSVRVRRDALLRSSSVVEIIGAEATMNDLGGLELFKHWLRDRAFVLRDAEAARKRGVVPARGVLLAGVPGCGKSLAARVAASTLDRPLLKLDTGRLMGRYLGESEANLREALAAAEAAAPCVLWIDELEKALAGSSGDGDGGGTARRMLGTLLTWMQEHRLDVFVIATANIIQDVPKELLRRGRFDAFFFFDLPTTTERAGILDVHLRHAGWRTEPADLLTKDICREATKDFSGADLEAFVKAAVEEAYLQGVSEPVLKREHFDAARKGFIPYGVQFKDDVGAIRREFDKAGFMPASAKEGEPVPEPRAAPEITKLPPALHALARPGPSAVLRFPQDRGWKIILSKDRWTAFLETGEGASFRRVPFNVRIDGEAKLIRLVAQGGAGEFERIEFASDERGLFARVRTRSPTPKEETFPIDGAPAESDFEDLGPWAAFKRFGMV